MGVGDFIPLIKAIMPPEEDADRRAQHHWQVAISVFTLSLGGVVAVHIAWACGMLPWVAGFASNADVVRLQSTARSIEIRIVSADLYEARKEQCKAIHDNEDGSKPGPLRRINALVADYQSMTGFSYRMPGCDEI